MVYCDMGEGKCKGAVQLVTEGGWLQPVACNTGS